MRREHKKESLVSFPMSVAWQIKSEENCASLFCGISYGSRFMHYKQHRRNSARVIIMQKGNKLLFPHFRFQFFFRSFKPHRGVCFFVEQQDTLCRSKSRGWWDLYSDFIDREGFIIENLLATFIIPSSSCVVNDKFCNKKR